MSEPEVWIESARVLVKRSRLVGGLEVIALVSVASVVAVLVVLTPRFLGFQLDSVGWSALLFVPVAALLTLFRSTRVDGAGAIGVAGSDLVLVLGKNRRQIPLAALASGRANPLRNEVAIDLRSGARIVATVPRAEDAERLLVAAGLDASKRTMRFELGETTFLDWLTLLLGPILVLPITRAILDVAPMPWGFGAILTIGLLALLFRLVRAAFGPAKLIVGADGIVIVRALGHRFVPFGRLASINLKPDVVDLGLTDGSRVQARAHALTSVQQAELRARLDAALAAFRRGEGDAAALARLDRGGRALDAWRAALLTIPDQHASYRETPLTREHLLAVLESPAAPAERRLGAALSLSASSDADIHARIHVAAAACANPRVRLALAKAADGGLDDAAIDAALADDEAAAPAPRTSEETP